MPKNAAVSVRDLWIHSDNGVVSRKISVEAIPAYGSYAFRLRLVGSSSAAGGKFIGRFKHLLK